MTLKEYIKSVVSRTGNDPHDIEELLCVTTLIMEHLYHDANKAKAHWGNETGKDCRKCAVNNRCPLWEADGIR